jgi:hypothetical protein
MGIGPHPYGASQPQERRAVGRHGTADPAEQSKTMAVPRPCRRLPGRPRQLDAGPLEPMIGSFALHRGALSKPDHSPPWTAARSLIVCHSIRPAQVPATTPGRLIWHRTGSRTPGRRPRAHGGGLRPSERESRQRLRASRAVRVPRRCQHRGACRSRGPTVRGSQRGLRRCVRQAAAPAAGASGVDRSMSPVSRA